jgi:cobalt-zinc-cadmium efflux system protein
LHLLFDGVPDSVDPQAVHGYLAAFPGISRVHDLHIWAMDTSQVALTAHLVMPHGHADDAFLKQVTGQLHDRFEITHATLQVVKVPFTPPCADWPSTPGAEPDGSEGADGASVHHHGHHHRA